MRNYMQMAEAAKRPHALLKYRLDNEEFADMTGADREKFWERMEAAHLFVFQQNDWPLPKDVQVTDNPSLAVPFVTCFFENTDKSGIPCPLLLGEGNTKILGVLLYELEPSRFDVYLFISSETAKPRIFYFPHEGERGNVMSWINQIWLERLSCSALGVEKPLEKVKLGTGTGQKRFRSIRYLIRVMPKTQQGHAPPLFSRHIDWTHRWTVRGHWRQHEGLGKNRAGDYCVEGHTWVTEHVRGPEDAPLIDSKVRLVS